MILLSLASKQIWPQVLAVLQKRPERLVLFHSNEARESKGPAERLRDFFKNGAIPNPPDVVLKPVPHDQFKDVVDAFAGIAEQLGIDGSTCQAHITGGNKLMAMAAAEWCRLSDASCFYIERESTVFPFQGSGGDLLPQPGFKLDPHLARDVDPVALLRCQLDSADIVHAGQRLTLNESGRAFVEASFDKALDRREDFTQFMSVEGYPSKHGNMGDGLEIATAFVLLKLGVPSVQRGVCLRSGSGRTHRQEEGELDLVFNWAGKLWVVDCKHRRTAESRVEELRTALLSQAQLLPEVVTLLDRITEELREKELKPLKEDLLAVSETGGLRARALVVRWNPLPTEAVEFARSRNFTVILKGNLWRDLRSQLYPEQPAHIDQLRALAKARTSAR